VLQLNFSLVNLTLKKQDGKTLVFDPVRKIWVILTPEEHVRQYVLKYLIEQANYPVALISVEKKMMVGNMPKRYDIVVYDRQHKPWMLIECKAPDITISEQTLRQLLQYQQAVQCRYWMLSNGPQSYCADAGNAANITWLEELPAYEL
jgi:Type I restriction enzyme R protein N terminus (HSDR_N).